MAQSTCHFNVTCSYPNYTNRTVFDFWAPPLKLHTVWSLSWFFLYIPSSGCTRPLLPIQTLSLPSAVLLPCHTLKSTMSSLLYRSYSYLLLLRKISPLKLISLESVALFPSSKFSLRMCTLSYLMPHSCTTYFRLNTTSSEKLLLQPGWVRLLDANVTL